MSDAETEREADAPPPPPTARAEDPEGGKVRSPTALAETQASARRVAAPVGDDAGAPASHLSLRGASSFSIDVSEGRSRGGSNETLPGSGVRPRVDRPHALVRRHDRIGRYLVLDKLGEGGMGEVYSAFDEELDRRVAIKLVHSRRGMDSIGRARIQREAQALAKLSHPNVVQVHDVGAHEGQVFLAMEFVRGVTLWAWQSERDPADPAARRQIIDMYIQAGRGLSAAHAQKLIHRDFKPENVLVGADGRARVLDFGLAAAQRGDEGAAGSAEELEVTEEEGQVVLRAGAGYDEITRTGAVMGTPAYMAPEQFLAQPTDARTDQFNFCVALYEALYRTQPFAGDTFNARFVEVTTGQIRPPPADTKIPEWLRAVLLRGLALHPDDRYPDIDALLAALADDPDARRRRRRRMLGLGALALVACALLILGGVELAGRVEERARRSSALERLAAVDGRIEALLAEGRDVEAERVFARFVDDPENRGTEADALAWLHRAERVRAGGDAEADERALDAYAAAYTLGAEAATQRPALAGIAGVLRARKRWGALAQALEHLGPAAEEEPAIAALRREAAVAQRDLDAALALPASPGQRALLEVLASATPTPYTHISRPLIGPCDDDGDARPELAIVTNDDDARITYVAAEPSLRELGAIDVGARALAATCPTPEDPAIYLLRAAHEPMTETGTVSATRRRGLDFAELFRWHDVLPRTLLAHDFDGDGAANYLFGTGPYSRHVLELREGPTGNFGTRAPAPAVDALASDVMKLLAADLDGDGAKEVIVALGPWRGYELQVLRYDPRSDGLVPRARQKVGEIADAVVVRRGDREEVAIFSRPATNAEILPRDLGDAFPAGLHVFRLERDALVETRTGSGESDGQALRAAAADLDGDGDDEILITTQRWQHRDGHTTIYRGAGAGFEHLFLDRLTTIGAHDLDGDGDDELFVTDLADEERRLWLIGVGDQRLPVLTPEGQAVVADEDAPTIGDPALARTWQHASELVAMGLDAQAADRLSSLADLTEDAGLRGRALLRAAALREGLGDDADAAAHYAAAAAIPGFEARAAEGAARSYRRIGDLERAIAALRVAIASAAADTRQDLAQALDQLERVHDDAGTTTLRFDVPLGPAWRIERPLALRRDPVRGALHVHSNGSGVLASLPLRRVGDYVAVDIDIDIEPSEWGSQLVVAVVPDDAQDPPLLGARASTIGGAGALTDTAECIAVTTLATRTHPVTETDASQSWRGRFWSVIDATRNEQVCRIDEAKGITTHYHRKSLGLDPLAPTYSLVIASRGDAAAWASARIYGIKLHGLVVADPVTSASDDDGYARAAAHLVEGDAHAALASLPGADAGDERRVDLWRAAGLIRLERWDEAIQPLRRVLEGAGAWIDGEPSVAAPDLALALMTMVKENPEVMLPLLRQAGGQELRDLLLVRCWQVALTMSKHARRSSTAILAALGNLEVRRGRPERLTAALSLRAGVYQRAGLTKRAIADYERLVDHMRRSGVEGRPKFTAHYELAAALALDGDLERAAALLRPLLDDPLASLTIRDRLRARDDLAALRSALALE